MKRPVLVKIFFQAESMIYVDAETGEEACAIAETMDAVIAATAYSYDGKDFFVYAAPEKPHA